MISLALNRERGGSTLQQLAKKGPILNPPLPLFLCVFCLYKISGYLCLWQHVCMGSHFKKLLFMFLGYKDAFPLPVLCYPTPNKKEKTAAEKRVGLGEDQLKNARNHPLS